MDEKTKELREAIKASKELQASAKEECTKLEKDMQEFKDNKEGKTEELKVSSSMFALQQKAYAVDSNKIGRNQQAEDCVAEEECPGENDSEG